MDKILGFLLVLIVWNFLQAESDITALQKLYMQAAQKVAPYVVQIRVDRIKEIPPPPPSFFLQDLEILPAPHRKSWKKIIQRSLLDMQRAPGPVSGIIISSQGEVITSAYNVAGVVRDIQVILPDDKRFSAKIVAISKADDLALLKIPYNSPSYLPMSNANISIGSLIAVIGRGVSTENYTLNHGIISAKKRFRNSSWQTDARINFANAGGVVVDIHGNFVGMVHRVTAFSKSGQSSGVGFFIPINHMRKILRILRTGKEIPLPMIPYLGIRIQSQQRNSDQVGIFVDGVYPVSPAAKLGLKRGDVIVAVNGDKITHRDLLSRSILKAGVGGRIFLQIARNGKIFGLKVTLAGRPEYY